MKRMKQFVAIVLSVLMIAGSVQGPVYSVFAAESIESENKEADTSENNQPEEEEAPSESSISASYEEDMDDSVLPAEETRENELPDDNYTEESSQIGSEISFDDENASSEEEPQQSEEDEADEENVANAKLNTENDQFMPAMVLSKEIEGTDTLLVVKAEEGTFPEGTTLEACYIENAELSAEIIEASEDEPSEIRIFLTDFLDAEGYHIGPQKEFYTEIKMGHTERTESPAVFQINEAEQVFSVEKLDEQKAEILFNQSEDEDIVSFRAGGTNYYALVYYHDIDTVEELQEEASEVSEISGTQDDVEALQSDLYEETEKNGRQEDKEIAESDEEAIAEEPGNTEFVEEREEIAEEQTESGSSESVSAPKKAAAVPTPLTGLNGEVVIASGYCGDDVQWYLHEDGTMWIFGEGEMTSHPWDSTHHDLIKRIVFDDGVTVICSSAFSSAKNLESIDFGKVETIENGAFSSCNSLEKVSIGNSVKYIGDSAFSSCSKLKELTVGDGVEEIGDTAFYFCNALESIIIGNSLKKIGRRAFEASESEETSGCEIRFKGDPSKISLVYTDGYVPNPTGYFGFRNRYITAYYPVGSQSTPGKTWGGAKNIDWIASNDPGATNIIALTGLNGEVVIASGYCGNDVQWYLHEDGTMWIFGEGEMTNHPWDSTHHDLIKRIVFDDGVTVICSSAFSSAKNLESIDFGKVETIENGAFSSCNSLEKVSIGNSVKYIGDSAFSSCSKLKELTVGDGVEEIGDTAFYFCNALESIIIGNSLKKIGRRAFEASESEETSGCEIRFKGDPSKISLVYTSGYVPNPSGYFGFLNRYITAYYPVGSQSTPGKTWGGAKNIDWIASNDPGETNIKALTGLNGEVVIASGYCGDDVQWYLHEDGTMWIFGEGEMTCHPWDSTHHDLIKRIVFDDGVTVICSSAFSSAKNLESIDFGKVETIENGAFSSCNSLEKVSIGNSVKYIGDSAFSSCSKLKELTVGDGVEEIGDTAFYFCNALESIIIGNSLKKIGRRAFEASESEETSGCEIRFKGDPSKISLVYTSGYVPNPSGYFGFLNRYITAYYPVGSQSTPGKTWGGAKNIDWFAYSTWNYVDTSISTEGIMLGDQSIVEGSTAERQIDIYTRSEDPTVLAGRASVTSGDTAVLEAVREDGLIKDGNTASILVRLVGKKAGSTSLTVDCGNGFTKTVNVTVRSAPAVNVNADETEIKSVAGIDPKSYVPNSVNVDVGKIQGPEVKVGKYRFNLFELQGTFALGFKESNNSVKVDPEKKTFRIMTGLDDDTIATLNDIDGYAKSDGDTAAVWDENWEKFRALYKDVIHGENIQDLPSLYQKYSDLNDILKQQDASLAVGVKAKYAFFTELSYATGQLECVDCGGTIMLGLSGKMKADIAPPFYLAFSGELSAEGGVSLKNWGDPFARTLELSLTPKFEVGLGVGMGDRAFTKTYVEGGLKGSLEAPTTYHRTFSDSFLTMTVELKGKLYFKASALWVFSYSNDIDLGPGVKLLDYRTGLKKSVRSKTVADIQAADFEPEPRTASASRKLGAAKIARLTANGAFSKDNTFAYTNPQMVTLDNNNKVLFWMEDVASKADDDRLTIYYSIYDAESDAWGSEQALFENEAYNGVPAIATDGTNVGVVWQRASRTLGTSGEMEELMGCLDLWYTEFDGESFSTPVCVSEQGNGFSKENYTLTMNAGRTVVAWTENSENDIFGLSGTNTLYQRSIENGSAGDVRTVASTESGISDVTMDTGNEEAKLSYRLIDGNESLLYIEDNNGTASQAVSGTGIAYSQWFGGELYYLKDNALYVDRDGGPVALGISGINNFKIVRNGDIVSLLTNVRDGNYSEIYRSNYDAGTDTWGNLVQITGLGGYIRSYDAEIADDGTVQLTVNLVQVTDDGETPYGTASVKVVEDNDYFDLIVGSSASYDLDKAAAGKSLPITAAVHNNSSKNLNSFQLSLKDGTGKVLKTETVTQEMNPGETKDLTIEYTIPSDFTHQTLTVSVSTDYEEANTGNNTASLEIGQADLAVNDLEAEFKDGVAQLSGNVTNNGFEMAGTVRIAVQDVTSGEYILEETALADKIGAGEMKEFTYGLPEQYWTLVDDSKRYELNVIVSSDSEESRLDNNTERIVFADLHKKAEMNRVAAITMDSTEMYMNIGGTSELTVKYAPADAVVSSLTWSSDNEEAVTVENGKITAVGHGDAKIIATTEGGASAACTVHVRTYSDPLFVWSEDHKGCTAAFRSEADGHEENVEASVRETRAEPSCTEPGEIVYTATAIFEEKTYTDTYREELASKGHTDEDGDRICDVCGVRTAYKVSLTSGIEGDSSGTTVAELQGGGIYAAKSDGQSETVKITAPAKVGYDFKGWYSEDGQLFDTKLSVSFTTDRDLTLRALYAPTGDKVTLRVSGGGFRITGSSNTQQSVTKKYTPGSLVSLSYVDESREFLHWVNESGRIVSREKTYEFTIISATTLEAVSVSAEDYSGEKMAFVEFSSYYDQILSAETYSSADEVEFPSGPSRKGYVFSGWDHTQEEIRSAIDAGETHITVKPVYEKTGNLALLTVLYAGAEREPDIYEAEEGTMVTVEAPEIDACSFSHWQAADGTLLSTKEQYNILVLKDAEIQAVYTAAGVQGMEKTPVIAMTGASAYTEDGKNKISFTAVRSLPEGYSVVEHGILRSTDASYGQADAQNAMVIGGANVKKIASADLSADGSYSINITVGAKTDTVVYARGYLVVRNQDGGQSTVYSENIFGYSFNELNGQ